MSTADYPRQQVVYLIGMAKPSPLSACRARRLAWNVLYTGEKGRRFGISERLIKAEYDESESSSLGFCLFAIAAATCTLSNHPVVGVLDLFEQTIIIFPTVCDDDS